MKYKTAIEIQSPKNNWQEFKVAGGYAISIFDCLDAKKSTIKDYKYRIPMFISFIEKNGFNTNSYLDYKRSLAERTDITVATKNKYLITARVFLRELNKKSEVPDITQNIKIFRESKKHKRDGLNENEIYLLSENLSNLPLNPKNTRLKAIFSLLALQGLRQIEIVRLDVIDFDSVSKILFVQGKGQDDKEPIDLHPKTVEALKTYLAFNNVKSGAMFQSRSNNSINKRLSTRGVRLIVKDILNKLEIKKTTHGFRHYFTTNLIKNYKGDLLEVASHTRHKSIDTLQIYYDRAKKKEDLPRYYKAFENVNF